tara:strand:+ start:562 stop:1119 length:558 start_codon:yes stop_codon:yes gene_type:complete
MFNVIENFYEPNDLGLMVMNFLNLPFNATYQSKEVNYGGDRNKGYPCYESQILNEGDKNNIYCPYNMFKQTFEKKTQKKIIKLQTFFRKTRIKELKKSPSWKQYKPHTDSAIYDIAGLIYYNSNCIKDGTYIFNTKDDFEPTVIIGSKYNRCVFYNSQQPHTPSMEQEVEERWIQPFFISYEKNV